MKKKIGNEKKILLYRYQLHAISASQWYKIKMEEELNTPNVQKWNHRDWVDTILFWPQVLISFIYDIT